MDDKLFEFLVVTDQLDEFLGYELPQEIKNKINDLVIDYSNDLISDDKVTDELIGIGKSYSINYELLYKYFKEQLEN
jgi:hypothetical protein